MALGVLHIFITRMLRCNQYTIIVHALPMQGLASRSRCAAAVELKCAIISTRKMQKRDLQPHTFFRLNIFPICFQSITLWQFFSCNMFNMLDSNGVFSYANKIYRYTYMQMQVKCHEEKHKLRSQSAH